MEGFFSKRSSRSVERFGFLAWLTHALKSEVSPESRFTAAMVERCLLLLLCLIFRLPCSLLLRWDMQEALECCWSLVLTRRP